MVGDKKTFSLYFRPPGYNTTPEYPLSLIGCSHMCINPLKSLTWLQSSGAGSLPSASGPPRAAGLSPAASYWCTLQSSAAWWLCWSVPADRSITTCQQRPRIVHTYTILQHHKREASSLAKRHTVLQFNCAEAALWWCSLPPPFRTCISNAAAYLYTVPLCLAGSSVLSQDYVKCRNPVWY